MMGASGALGIFPGISSVGAMTAVASVCGAERTYALNVSLMMNMVIQVLLIFFDLLAIVSGGLGKLTFGILLCDLVAAAAAFLAVNVAVRVMRTMASARGYAFFAWYSLAMAFLMFILYLMV